MGVYYLSLILCDFSLSSDTTDHAFLLFTVFSNTVFSASPETPRLVRLCFPGSPSSSSAGCCSSVLRLWPPLLHCTPWLSSSFHYPGVSHHLKAGNPSIFLNCPLGPFPMLQTHTLPSCKCSKLNMHRRNSACCVHRVHLLS